MNKEQYLQVRAEFRSVFRELSPGHKIIQLMQERGIESQNTLVKLLGLKQARTSKIISNKLAITTEVAIRLAALFPEYTAAQWMACQASYDIAFAIITGLESKLKREIRERKKRYIKQHSSIVMDKKSHKGSKY